MESRLNAQQMELRRKEEELAEKERFCEQLRSAVEESGSQKDSVSRENFNLRNELAEVRAELSSSGITAHQSTLFGIKDDFWTNKNNFLL